MTGQRAPAPWRTWAAAALALLFLNASLTFENVWPTPAVTWGHALSAELAAVVLVLAAARRRAWAAGRLLPALWLLLVVGRYLDVTAPGLYGREFNLYWDSQHLGNVAAMLVDATALPVLALAAAGVALVVLAAYLIARVAFASLAAALDVRPARRAVGVVAGALVLVFACQQVADGFPVRVPFADPVTPAYVRQARFVAGMVGPWAVAPALGPGPALDARLDVLRGADVLLVFVESYGAVAFESADIDAGLSDGRRELQAAIATTGRRVRSAYVESPTFGGSSWLAHLSLLSGIEVRDQYAYTSLMASERETIVTLFGRRGYRTVAIMPGMRQSWPEGAFYGFDAIYGRDLLEYEGPQFGWWSIPDQYALARLDALERSSPARAPLFAVFPTSTTHAPFGPVPPYQPDWSRVLTNEAFDAGDVDRAMAAAPDLMNLRPAYVRAMSYEYRAFAGYLRQNAGDDLVMILVGDHQPPAAVAGPDASWSVPVHVIARNEAVIEALSRSGFRPGLVPQRPAIGPMPALVPILLESFSVERSPEDGRILSPPPQPRDVERERPGERGEGRRGDAGADRRFH